MDRDNCHRQYVSQKTATTIGSEANMDDELSSLGSQRKPSIPHVPQQTKSNHHHHLASSCFKRLIGACKQKDLNTVRLILREQPDLINQRDRYQRNLLHYTVILFKRQQQQQQSYDGSTRYATSFDSSQSVDIDQDETNQLDERLAGETLACFNHLLDRCQPKLWWQQDLDGLSLLHLAVISSNLPLVNFIIYEHSYSIKYPLVSCLDNERHSPLHWAVITNNLACVKLLLASPSSAGAANLINEPDFNGATPLHYATQTNDYPKYRRQLRLMLRNIAAPSGPTPEQQSAKETIELTAATNEHRSSQQLTRRGAKTQSRAHAQHLEVLETLVKTAQVNLECRDKDGRTPLLWAASSGNREALLLLLGAGADAHSCDTNKLSALHCAASHGFTECLEGLIMSLRAAPPSTTTAGISDKEAEAKAVNQPDNLNCTPIFYAVLSGNIDCVELLADGGSQLDWQDSKGRSCCHFAALKGQLNSLKLLRRRGANLWLANRQGDLPLHYACKGGRHQVTRWLFDHSPYENSVNAINNFGRAPLHLILQRGGDDQIEMLDYLIKRGANLNQLVKVKDRSSSKSSRHHNGTHRQGPMAMPSSSSVSELTPSLSRNGGQHPHCDDSPKRTKDSGTEYHYETALDMAKKSGYDACFRLLLENGARSAQQVIGGRNSVSTNGIQQAERGATNANVHSLFDLQSVEGPSPIGFDTTTSSSSVAASPAANHHNHNLPHQQLIDTSRTDEAPTPRLPKLSRPSRPDSLPQSSDSSAAGGSSALSQNSLTSVRGTPHRQPNHFHHNSSLGADNLGETGPTKPKPSYKGGISYNNERINASIKCKLYDANQHSSGGASFPPFFSARMTDDDFRRQQQQQQKVGSSNGRPSRQQSAPTSGQEIITNVNVYTSPCPVAAHQHPPHLDCCCATSTAGNRRAVCKPKQRLAGSSPATEDESEATSDGPATETESCDDTEANQQPHSRHWGSSGLPDLQQQQPVNRSGAMMTQHQRLPQFGHSQQQQHHQLGNGRLPPSQGHEQHLPVILSDRETEATTSGGETSNERSPEVPGGVATGSQMGRTVCCSPACEQPLRFDRAGRGYQQAVSTGKSMQARQHQQVRSPVAEYIRAPLGTPASTQHHEQQHQGVYESHHLPDFSQVKPKVDSHRPPDQQQLSFRSRSLSRQQQQRPQQVAGDKQAALDAGTCEDTRSRSVSRQTFVKEQHQNQHMYRMAGRQGSQDSFEFELGLERSIRKFKQEKRLFEELQGLKRSQIRSGRANEAVLVKRLVEHLRREQRESSGDDLLGLDHYSGPYTYKAYERFLYDQLRKLSQSNCTKLSRSMRDFEQELNASAATADCEGGFDPVPMLHPDADDLDELNAEQQRKFLDDDLKADMELRRVIESGETNQLEDPQRQKEVGQAVAELQEIEHKSERLADQEQQQEQEREIGTSSNRQESLDASQQPDESKSQPNQEPEVEQVVRGGSIVSPRSSVSSRKSSIEAERDKLKSLPLQTSSPGASQEVYEPDHPPARDDSKVNDDDDDDDNSNKKSLVEDEANSICSAIMVDALGNLAQRSPVPSEVLSTPEEGSVIIDESEEGHNGVPEEKANGDSSIDVGLRSRRRSVVNIGNKMEVIYHDVGIEIDPVGDPPATDDSSLSAVEDEPRGQIETEVAETTDKATLKDTTNRASELPSMEDVKEEEEGEDEEVEHKRMRAHEIPGENEISGIDRGSTQGPADQSVPDKPEHQGRSKDDEDGDAQQVEQHAQSDAPTLRARTATRRASSPQGHIERHNSPGGSVRKFSSIDSSSAAGAHKEDFVPYAAEIKKVFNGYDLDELHQARRVAQQSVESQKDPAVGGSNKVDSMHPPLGRDASHKSADAVRRGDAARRRAKKPRSRLPHEKFEPRVNVQQIKQRWSRVKAVERRRLQHQRDLLGQQVSYFAKSQPNLDQQERSAGGGGGDEETMVADWQPGGLARQNYQLLYEINMTRSSCREKAEAAHGKRNIQSGWCQRRIVRIVDVRSLKRTLSLPESVMYSNVLLKRFNILKL